MIQWFPGHMAKARRDVENNLKKVDLLIELLDARLPISSRNPEIDELAKRKPRVVLLNKSDLADPRVTSRWKARLSAPGITVLSVNAQDGQGVALLFSACEQLMREKIEVLRSKGIQPPPIRAMIVGIPNVGKSTLINRLANKKAVKTGDRPGITRQPQWIAVKGRMQLLDTPGILWPKFEVQEVGYRLAASGAIRDEILDVVEVALFAIDYLKARYAAELTTRYHLEKEELTSNSFHLLEIVGRKRGCLKPGGGIDLEKAADLFLHDLRGGKIGMVSLEWPEDWPEI